MLRLQLGCIQLPTGYEYGTLLSCNVTSNINRYVYTSFLKILCIDMYQNLKKTMLRS